VGIHVHPQPHQLQGRYGRIKQVKLHSLKQFQNSIINEWMILRADMLNKGFCGWIDGHGMDELFF
jgi:hypothetical protein